MISHKIILGVFLRQMKNKKQFSNHRKLLITKFFSLDLNINGRNSQIQNIYYRILTQIQVRLSQNLFFGLKGVTGYVRYLNWVCSVVENFFLIYLRHISLFKSVNPECERKFDVQNSWFGGGYAFRISFFKLLINDDIKCKNILQ